MISPCRENNLHEANEGDLEVEKLIVGSILEGDLGIVLLDPGLLSGVHHEAINSPWESNADTYSVGVMPRTPRPFTIRKPHNRLFQIPKRTRQIPS